MSDSVDNLVIKRAVDLFVSKVSQLSEADVEYICTQLKRAHQAVGSSLHPTCTRNSIVCYKNLILIRVRPDAKDTMFTPSDNPEENKINAATLGKRMLQARENLELGLEDLSSLTGVSESVLRSIEAGQTLPSPEVLLKLRSCLPL